MIVRLSKRAQRAELRSVVTLTALFVGLATGCADTLDDAAHDSAATEVKSQIDALLEEFPDATQVDDNAIAWNDGSVVLELTGTEPVAPEAASPDSVPGIYAAVSGRGACPSGWYCVYEHADYNTRPGQTGARMLRFSQCTTNRLGDYGFRDRASSWVNNSRLRIRAMNALGGRPDEVLWTMGARSASAYVGNAKNDRADHLECI